MNSEPIAASFPYPSNYLDINGVKMHYIKTGEGDPILFLHGVPTSAYLWRNVIPHLSSLGQCIAPDLIGFGQSDKTNIPYSITDHIQSITSFIEKLNLKNIIMVLHGWGSIIGFDYAMRHQERIKGLVFYESYIRPVSDEDFSLPFEEQIYTLHEEETSKHPLQGTEFIERILSEGMVRSLSEEEWQNYRKPFLKAHAEKPILQYLKELPKANNKTNQIIMAYSEQLQKSKIPKLMLYSIPGFITTISTIIWAKEHLPCLETNEIGEALHYAQESNPALMGESISVWLQGIEQQTLATIP